MLSRRSQAERPPREGSAAVHKLPENLFSFHSTYLQPNFQVEDPKPFRSAVTIRLIKTAKVALTMNTEQIYKLQPDRTFYLRGFTGRGAAASLCQTSPSGFTACGVFRDMADFCVLVIFDADNTFEHYSVRYLPDFDLSGIKLSFDVSYKGLQPLDSAKYSWIDWA